MLLNKEDNIALYTDQHKVLASRHSLGSKPKSRARALHN